MLYDGGGAGPSHVLPVPNIACLGNQVLALQYAGCPLCMREVNMLRRRDEGAGKICFVDIDAPDYSPADNAGISYEQGMANIHGVLPDGKVITNVEVRGMHSCCAAD